MKIKTYLFFVFTCFLVLSFANISEARQTVTLNPGDNIQQAVNNAGRKTKIILNAGVYTVSESIKITQKRELSIKGNGKVSIVCTSTQETVFNIKDSFRIMIANIHMTHRPTATGCSEGVVNIYKSREIILQNCDINGCGVYGVNISNCTRVAVLRSKLHNNEWIAINASNSKEIVILKNIITNNGSVASFSKINDLKIYQNRIYNNRNNKINYRAITKKSLRSNRFN